MTGCPYRSGSSFSLGVMPYGQRWRRHRRAFWQYFHRDAVEQYREMQQTVTHVFLDMLLEDPSRLSQLIRL